MTSVKNPFGLLSKFNRQVENTLDDQGDQNGSLGRWIPSSDIYRKNNQLEIDMDLSGVDRDNLEVNLQGNRLNVRGVRDANEHEARNYYRKERLMGSFRRSFNLPGDLDHENVQAKYDDGVLSITIPIQDNGGSQSVDIN